MGNEDEQIGTCADGSDCDLCASRDGYCQWHGDDDRDGGGRPELTFTDTERRQVKFLAASGWTVKDISKALGVARKTLRKHFEFELEAGESMAVGEVAAAFFDAASSGDHPRASLDWLERRDPEHWLPADERGTTAADDDQISENEEGDEIWEIQMPDEGIAR